jgi:alkanesulfonate monooxygenase SsuD/methylene tetrahydromethanopterin reductase-like flavin-dependent oxidoreductase (luciferase family)
MKFGVLFRAQFLPDEDARRCFEDLCMMVRQADALGFDSITKGSHYGYADLLDFQQIPMLARLATEAPNCRLNTGIVLLSLHKPVDIAEQLATLDVITNGKLIFGCGLGYRDVEFAAFGTSQGERVQRLEENLSLVKRLWAEDEVSHEGSHFSLDGVTLGVKPLQKPYPPIWMGANADAAIKRAARIADCWYMPPHNRISSLLRQFDVYKRELDRIGKALPDELPLRREIFVAPNREQALSRCRKALETKYQSYHRWGQGKPMPENDGALGQSLDDVMKDRFILGAPAEVADRIIELCAPLGANHLVISIHNPGMEVSVAMDAMQLFAEEVMPVVDTALPSR